jgi:hypothetical protein
MARIAHSWEKLQNLEGHKPCCSRTEYSVFPVRPRRFGPAMNQSGRYDQESGLMVACFTRAWVQVCHARTSQCLLVDNLE